MIEIKLEMKAVSIQDEGYFELVKFEPTDKHYTKHLPKMYLTLYSAAGRAEIGTLINVTIEHDLP